MTHGFVQNLARPGGNATGFTIMEPTTTGKWLELLKEIAPRSNRAALLFNPATAPYASIYLNPFKPPLRPSGWSRSPQLCTTGPNSIPSSQRRHASQIAD